MSAKQVYVLPVAMSLTGGIILLIVSIINITWFGANAPSWGGIGDYMRSMMGGYHNFMGAYASSTAFFEAVSIVSLVCGVIVIIGASVLRAHPQEHVLWGIVIIIFSVVSFVGMGGYFIGAILGIIGGILALTYKPLV